MYFEVEDICRDKPAVLHRPNDHYSNWYCLDCGASGEPRAYYKSTLRTRRRGHLICRCKKR